MRKVGLGAHAANFFRKKVFQKILKTNYQKISKQISKEIGEFLGKVGVVVNLKWGDVNQIVIFSARKGTRSQILTNFERSSSRIQSGFELPKDFRCILARGLV